MNAVIVPAGDVHASTPAQRGSSSVPQRSRPTTLWQAAATPASNRFPPAPVGKPLTRLTPDHQAKTVASTAPLLKHTRPIKAAGVLTAPTCTSLPVAAGNGLSMADAGTNFDPWAWGADFRNGSSGVGDLVPSPVPGPSTLSQVSSQFQTMLQIAGFSPRPSCPWLFAPQPHTVPFIDGTYCANRWPQRSDRYRC